MKVGSSTYHTNVLETLEMVILQSKPHCTIFRLDDAEMIRIGMVMCHVHYDIKLGSYVGDVYSFDSNDLIDQGDS